MLILDLFEELQGPPEPTLIDALRDFLPLAVKHLELKKLPKIKLLGDVETEHMPSFGKFSNDDRTVHLGIKNRHPNDVLRTLAHELTHYAQGEHGKLDADSGATGSPEEDQANAEAGVIMREFNGKFPQYMELKPIMLEKWSKKYKKSINCSNPKGFSQKAHCAGRKKNTKESVAEGAANWGNKSKSVKENFADGEIKESKETRQALLDQHFEFPQQGQYGYRTGYQGRGVLEVADGRTGKIINLGEFGTFDGDREPNQKWLRIVFTNPNMDDNAWDELEDMLWSDDQVAENFADGRNPQDKGDSKRHGIPKGATMAQLEKAARAPGRKGQLARWQINMRRGRKK
jgi:Zn-dependent peptidase ImmA (M78 family)